MHLPEAVSQCIQRLEQAGFSAYAVGGCVRDALLGLTPQDYDLCTAASPGEIRAVFQDHPLVLAGEKHGTIGVVTGQGVIEITTYRTEGGYADSRHPDWVEFVTDITQDLARRDFTVNAMAYSPTRGFADPFGGGQDLENRLLRAVGDPTRRFGEDALRILRGARFAARYQLQVEKTTEQAMFAMAGHMESLARERVFEELGKLLLWTDAARLCRFAPLLRQVIPELAPTMGFDQKSRHHAYDVFTHTAHVVQAVAPTLPLRWAALLHDIGKPGCFHVDEAGEGHFYDHASQGAAMAETVLRRLKAPNALREQVVTLIRQHMTKIPPERKAVRRWMGRLGGETLEQLLQLQEADMGSKGTGIPPEAEQFTQLRQLMQQLEGENACLTVRQLAINGHDLLALGYAGPQIGRILQALLQQVLDEQLPNERDALLQALPKE